MFPRCGCTFGATYQGCLIFLKLLHVLTRCCLKCVLSMSLRQNWPHLAMARIQFWRQVQHSRLRQDDSRRVRWRRRREYPSCAWHKSRKRRKGELQYSNERDTLLLLFVPANGSLPSAWQANTLLCKDHIAWFCGWIYIYWLAFVLYVTHVAMPLILVGTLCTVSLHYQVIWTNLKLVGWLHR